jgi:hypothetical protein
VTELICPSCGAPGTADLPLCPTCIQPLVPRPQPGEAARSLARAAEPASALATDVRAPTDQPSPPAARPPAPAARPPAAAARPPAAAGPAAATQPCADPDCPHDGLLTTGCFACGTAPRKAAAASSAPRLRFPWGDEEVPAGGPLPIGRENSPVAQRLSAYTNVGRRHAEVTVAAGQLAVMDLNSVNGTFVNDERLEPLKPRPLRVGDELRFAAGLRVTVVRGT